MTVPGNAASGIRVVADSVEVIGRSEMGVATAGRSIPPWQSSRRAAASTERVWPTLDGSSLRGASRLAWRWVFTGWVVRAGHEDRVAEVARVMEYTADYEIYGFVAGRSRRVSVALGA